MKRQVNKNNSGKNLVGIVRNLGLALVAIVFLYSCTGNSTGSQESKDSTEIIEKKPVDTVAKQDTTKKTEVELKK